MTPPAHYDPLVFPSVAFRPVRLAAVSAVVTAVVVAVATYLGAPLVALFFGLGMAVGLGNALLVRRSVLAITARAHPLKTQLAANSALRVVAITSVALAVAFFFRPAGIGAVFGVAVFQVVLVASTTVPLLAAMRRDAYGSGEDAERIVDGSGDDERTDPHASAGGARVIGADPATRD